MNVWDIAKASGPAVELPAILLHDANWSGKTPRDRADKALTAHRASGIPLPGEIDEKRKPFATSRAVPASLCRESYGYTTPRKGEGPRARSLWRVFQLPAPVPNAGTPALERPAYTQSKPP